MNTKKSTGMNVNRIQQKSAKLAGVSILTFMILSIIHFLTIDANLIVSDNILEIVSFIKSNDLLFRMGIVLDLVIFITGIIIAVALYSVFKSVSRNIALIGFSVILIQATLAIVTELTSYISLSLLSGKAYLQGLDAEQLNSLLGVFLKLRFDGFNITGMLFSLGMVFFFYLFIKSKFSIPSKKYVKF
ncbi:MAG: DUF4386 domain-containing protein [bacterium]|nr:DUF4386 domain-containing protein [bacterium]